MLPHSRFVAMAIIVTLHSSQVVASGAANPNLVSVHLPPTTNVMVSPTALCSVVVQPEIGETGEQLWTMTVHWYTVPFSDTS